MTLFGGETCGGGEQSERGQMDGVKQRDESR